MKTQAIVPTAGKGQRMHSDVPKPFINFNNKPLFVNTLLVLDRSPSIDSVILVGNKDNLEEYRNAIRDFDIQKVKQIVAGGQHRCDSVKCGLQALDEDTQIVLVHDGARPLVSVDLIESSIRACVDHDAVIAAVKVKPTIKRVDDDTLVVEATLRREKLWEVQTPQTFKKDIIVQAHQSHEGENPTDDSQMVEQLGIEVKVVEGEYQNIKITTQEDVKIAEALVS